MVESLAVVIRNQGNTAVSDELRVDVYFDPNQTITRGRTSRSPTLTTILPPNTLQRTTRPLYHAGIYTVPVSREGEHLFYCF